MNDTCSKKMKHLEMIEGIIERMGNNSFQLKGWAVTLVSIIGTLSAQGSDKRFFLISFLPLFAFWLLDSSYLQKERKYRVLYKNISVKKEKNIDFNMDIQNIVCSEEDMLRICYFRCLFSGTEVLLYGVISVAVLLLFIILKVF